MFPPPDSVSKSKPRPCSFDSAAAAKAWFRLAARNACLTAGSARRQASRGKDLQEENPYERFKREMLKRRKVQPARITK
jgi:hypothetical protein